ncbi:hypothetical protein D9756_005484 [Leucocoprinus leucothites]|uniref:DNA2/NAM7 helicase-like C-terminal domain-containing protein n=1 Tax=Leucocoprinus leucothites TaxID=201217 RepID=A0A8H5FZS2_9AGAR|nr:hypothetical protein D9756_005484 [Leucoagaricus leucothites]
MAKASISATNIAVYHHLNCDLYLWKTYNEPVSFIDPPKETSELSRAQYHRGEEWESILLEWLDKSDMLLRVPPKPMEAEVLIENILADDRDHFFIAGLCFWPPRDRLAERFEALGNKPVNFGLCVPDLLEVEHKGEKVSWKVVDAKASKSVKTPHHAQIYFYTLCLKYILRSPFFECGESAGIWLPPSEGFDIASPSLTDIKSIDINLLSSSLDAFLFRRLPHILAQRRDQVQWHLNPSCKGCKFAHSCEEKTVETGRLGVIPNLSVEDAQVLKDLLHLGRRRLKRSSEPLTDIEELHTLVNTSGLLKKLSSSGSTTVKKARQLLAIPRRKRLAAARTSPIVEAAISKKIQIIPRLNYTCPSKEDITIVLSFISDPSTTTQALKKFCITTYTSNKCLLPRISTGDGEDLIVTLANLIRLIIGLQKDPEHNHLTTQFYVWSTADRHILQANLINAALSSDASADDARLCIGALAQGAALLQTAYQPILLSGALLGFLSKRRRLKREYQACLARMDLPTTGTAEECRKRVEAAIIKLNEEKEDSLRTGQKQRELGQIPRVIVLKREVERLFALPVAGHWDLEECTTVMLPQRSAVDPPSEEELYRAFRRGSDAELQKWMEARNHAIHDVLMNMRERTCPPTGSQLLINEAKALSVNFMDLCRSDTLRKLFYMQQFEVLTKLTELWNSRIDGCPDAPVLEFRSAKQGARGIEYTFKLVSGILDMPPDKEHPFYDKLLVKDVTLEGRVEDTVPVEALFDDLAVSGCVFPLNRYTRASWEAQPTVVQEQLVVADIKDIKAIGLETIVVLRIWGTWKNQFEAGGQYHLSPRFVDFNTTKVLSSLFEIDLQYETDASVDVTGLKKDLAQVPYLQLILEPRTFGHAPLPETSLKIEGDIQKLFRDLSELGSASAKSLVLKPSQHKAVQRILTNRLSVIWGPPGTGKTYTICLSLLRLLEVERRQDNFDQRVIFLTAMTHAAIEAMLTKLSFLMDCYRTIASLPTEWLDDVKVERVIKGNEHAGPGHTHLVYIYAGTLYQLYNFTKNRNLEVDTLVADEAGQIALGSLSLVMRALSPSSRLIVAGDSEQLAPILSAQYPQLQEQCLFGSVLDSLMHARETKVESKVEKAKATTTTTRALEVVGSSDDVLASQGTVVQLTENFRLNPDLGEFVSTIYSRQFKAQKFQARQIAILLQQAEEVVVEDFWVSEAISEAVRRFLISLSSVMLRKPQDVLKPPQLQLPLEETTGIATDLTLNHQPISLALIRLRTWTSPSDHVPYEMHVHGEAAVAASLVGFIRKCSPNDDIFVATPHRIQREAVKNALQQSRGPSPTLEVALGNLKLGSHSIGGQVTVDTIERLQGSEAAFVICLFSLPQSHTADLGFLLERRRLNVAISRAKSLCILVTSDEVLRPSVRILANEDTAKGYAFLKAYEARAWSYDLSVDLDDFRKNSQSQSQSQSQ